MPTPEHDALRIRVADLANRLINFVIPIDRDPSIHELDMIASFKLLVHAEFETFIETRVRDTVRVGVHEWKINRKMTKALFGLLLRWYPHFEPEKNPFSVPQNGQQIVDLIDRLLRKAEKEIDDNNGIKKDATSRLCYSACILSDDISQTLLAALDSYGRLRGDVAHNSIGKVQTLNAPEVEASEANQIVTLLIQLDQQLQDAIT